MVPEVDIGKGCWRVMEHHWRHRGVMLRGDNVRNYVGVSVGFNIKE